MKKVKNVEPLHLLSLRQASEFLHVHPNTLRSWDKKGILKAKRFGIRRDRTYALTDLEQLILGKMGRHIFAKNPDTMAQKSNPSPVTKTSTEKLKNMLEDLYNATLTFLVPLTEQETYYAIVEEAKKLAKAQYGSIFMPDGDGLRRVYSSSHMLSNLKIRKKGLTVRSFQERKASQYFVRRAKEPHPILKRLGIKTVVYIPLTYEGKSIGVQNLLFYQRLRFSPEELHMFELFGSLASLAIYKAKAYSDTKIALDNRNLFISMASHEIKTPLTSLHLYIQMLEKDLRGKRLPSMKSVKMLSSETKRLTKLINEFLHAENPAAETFTYHMKKRRLTEIIHRGVEEVMMAHRNHSIEFDSKDIRSDSVFGDFDKLLQMFINLFNNAAKFSPPDEPITVSLTEEGDYCIVSVADRGEGISAKDKKRIFEKYYRGNSKSKSGMGLGLYLVKNIINEHKGKISIRSKLHKGTKVTIALPKYGES